jgi:hypothetical protein
LELKGWIEERELRDYADNKAILTFYVLEVEGRFRIVIQTNWKTDLLGLASFRHKNQAREWANVDSLFRFLRDACPNEHQYIFMLNQKAPKKPRVRRASSKD